jgi:putative transposase
MRIGCDSVYGAESGAAAMWTKTQREKHKPRTGRYPSDCTDAEWAMIEPLIPPQRSGGRRRETNMRDVFDAILYINRTGCQWRQLPNDFPPQNTVYGYFWDWSRYGVLDRIHAALLGQARQACGREPDPTAGIIDTQVAKATEKGGRTLIRLATTRARKSRASSATRSSIRKATCS